MKLCRLGWHVSRVFCAVLMTCSLADAADFVVTTANDTGDGSLRWAIEQANSNEGSDTITFDAGYTVFPETELPALSDPTGGTTIDGGDNTVVIDGSIMNADPVSGEVKGDYGIKIASDNNLIRNLHVRSVRRGSVYPYKKGVGVWINGNSNTLYACKIYLNDMAGVLLADGYPNNPVADYNKIQACYIGSADGLSQGQGNGAASLSGGTNGGIYGHAGAKYTIIGVDGDGINDASEGNVISGNSYPGGITLYGMGTRIAGNLIGVDKTGTYAIPNTGVAGIASAGSDSVIGTNGDGVSDDLERNVISGNQKIAHGGVRLSDGARFSGNYVGVDITGTKAIPNEGWGVSIISTSYNLIGTNSDGVSDELERNIISGNQGAGIACPWSSSHALDNVRISGNFIGTDITGTVAIGNGGAGIGISPINVISSNNTIIGTDGDGINDEVEANVISANATGIYIGPEHGYAGMQISGNFIGTDRTGTVALPNKVGVRLYRTTDNIIGTNGDGFGDEVEGNVIVASVNAIELDDWYLHGAERNKISGNKIGVDVTGNIVLGKGTISIDNSHNNVIGTDGDGVSDALEGNIIAGGSYNFYISNSTANRISGNSIGLGADGTTLLASVVNGLSMSFSDNNIIGTNGDGISDELEGNIIVTNGARGNGIQISYSSGNFVAGNTIGTDKSASLAGGFGGSGILVNNSSNNLIGTNWDGVSDHLEGNVITNNGFDPYAWWYENDGVAVLGAGHFNAIRGNSIYNNVGQGIQLLSGANQSILAPTIVSANYVSGGIEVPGIAPADSNVEIFSTDPMLYGDGEGKDFQGKVQSSLDGTFSVVIPDMYLDEQLLTATATDQSSNTSEFSVSSSVTGNLPPELVPIGDKSVNEMEYLTFPVVATDPNNDPVRITAAPLPRGAFFDGAEFTWTPDYTQAGSYPVTFTATDSPGGATDSETIYITVVAVNAPPTAAPSGGGTYNLSSDIILGGQVADYDGDLLDYRWYENDTEYCTGQIATIEGGTEVELPSCVLSGVLAVDEHDITLEVSDRVNAPVSASVHISVVDTNAPTLAPVADKTILWPPNHRMEEIVITANVWDDSGCYDIDVNVTSNEPENGLGDGDTGPDITEPVIDYEAGTITFSLRAERSGLGDGRVYSVNIVATDCSGNVSEASLEIVCPHNKKGK